MDFGSSVSLAGPAQAEVGDKHEQRYSRKNGGKRLKQPARSSLLDARGNGG